MHKPPDELGEKEVWIRFNLMVGDYLQQDFNPSGECVVQANPTHVLIVPAAVGRPISERTKILIVPARDDGFYVTHIGSENGHPSFGMTYKPGRCEMLEHLRYLGVPERDLRMNGLMPDNTSQAMAGELLGKLIGRPAGRTPDSSAPA
jgi:hypothetical protein